MIGVVGSADSVGLVSAVAGRMKLNEVLICRAYDRPENAPSIAAEIDAACSVILFTGRVPYALTMAQTEVSAATDYVPHSGVDLYRTLVVLARRYKGELPQVSIDTIDIDVVRENFEEAGLVPPTHVFDLDPLLAGGVAGTDTIVEFHQKLHRDGLVDLCITCLSTVRDRLEQAGVPVERVAHTQGAVRDSLRRAALTSSLQRLEASQVAVLATGRLAAGEIAEADSRHEDFRALAGHLRGELLAADTPSPSIVTTRGAIERQLMRSSALQKTLERLAGTGTWIGVGLGHSLAHAQEQANYAITISAATGDHQVVLPDGSVRRLVDAADTFMQVRDPGDRLQAAARLSGIGPMTLARLRTALASIGRNDVTAKELARAYGVEPRSARRLLNALLKAGIAELSGALSAPRAGRPQVVYTINVDALLDPAAKETSRTPVASQEGR